MARSAGELMEALQQAADMVAGKLAPGRIWSASGAVEVRAIRARTRLSQRDSAKRFGFSTSAVREREQGRRQPEAAARVLLLVIASRPEVVDEALAAASQPCGCGLER
jgi:putative transcriptional regulator